MLQPRLSSKSASGKMGKGFNCAVLAVVLIFCATLSSCQDVDNNYESEIEATRLKRDTVPNDRDLTVLLVNDQKRELNSRVGRYHSVKPLIGLLTATTRTFIQDGVTTEFATQILGTTLDNGRIYAQILTKSSLVLYNKPSNVEDAIVVKPTRTNFDGQWNVKQDLGFIDPDKFVLKNTDYVAPSDRMEIVYPSKLTNDNLKYWNVPTSPDTFDNNNLVEEPTGRKVQTVNEIPRYEVFNLLDGPGQQAENKFVVKPSILENVNTLHRNSKVIDKKPEIKVESKIKEELIEPNVIKVKPELDLPTFTIKNEFSPVFYYIDNVESKNLSPQADLETKLPKRLFGQKSEPRPKKTFTYEGFADFTTVVGDTVIVFTPNTDLVKDPIPGEVNVFPSAKRVDKLASKITFLASDIPVATATFKPFEKLEPTKLTTPKYEENRSEKALYNDEESLEKALYDIDDKIPDAISVQSNNGFNFNLDVIQPSESSILTTENTKVTGDLDESPIKSSNSIATDPLVTIKPSSAILKTDEQSVITDNRLLNSLSNSDEETDNTASEIMESNEEIVTEDKNIVTTTENTTTDESEEEIEVTTIEDKPDSDFENEECTQGLETKSTMTTSFKTLTYLTTYFIPLEGTETTTSIKSDVVVESDVGYLTNIVCKTNLEIEPTAVLSADGEKSSILSSLDKPEVQEEYTSEKSVSEVEVPITEETTTVQNKNEENDENNLLEKDSTTTEKIHESSHYEVSVSTETTSTSITEKPISPVTNKDEENVLENEIDVIYKTLYTTYTYFTTFFGDSTSSVASHKSVVTNIITATVNVNLLDPSLLGAFNEDEIAPTNVGIGRPTAINSIIDLVKNKDVLESVEKDDVYSSQTPTPSLGDDIVASIKPDAVKTYFTTYTFFTTIFVGTDANVCSRSEVYTNYVGPEELIPTKTNPLIENTRIQFDFRNCKQVKGAQKPINTDENSSVETSVRIGSEEAADEKRILRPNPSPVEVDMLLSVDSNPIESENSYTTDVKSSSSKGEQKYLENNNVIEDQISSESNVEEIMPSPTLLLQTSYTTFTYFTTLYIGKDSSKIKSRLETITNVVTETIWPKKEPEIDENLLPITYYTTFTYWTTLYKDNATTITSREEVVSNIVTPTLERIAEPTVSPIDTTPIEGNSELPPKELDIEVKPSLIGDSLEQDDGKATFYTTYTYFTTFYVGNTSQIRSSLETVTNIVDNTKLIDDNQLGRKVASGSDNKNLVQNNEKDVVISPTALKEQIKPTQLPDISGVAPTVLSGTFIDNLFAEIKPTESSVSNPEKKILYSQVAVISGNSVVITNDNKTLNIDTNSTSTTPTDDTLSNKFGDDANNSSNAVETTTEGKPESDDEDDTSSRKKGRLTFSTKKPSFVPVIRPFASRNRPTFSPKRVPSPSSATTITRSDFTPTITATPVLKSVRPTAFGANRKQSVFPGGSGSSRRFAARNSISNIPSNIPSPSKSGGFPRASIQPTLRKSNFRSNSLRGNDYPSRSVLPKIKPTLTNRIRGGRQSASITLPVATDDQNESETFATQNEENITESLEEVTETPAKTTANPLFRFRRPNVARQPGASVTPRPTVQTTPRKTTAARGRITTTTRKTTTRTTPNPLLSLRRQRPNALFPRRNLLRQPEPEPEEEIKDNAQEVDEEQEEIFEGEDNSDDNEYDSSDRKEQQVSTPSTPAPRKAPNTVQIRPFRRRAKRQVDYGNRKFSNFRRTGSRAAPNTRRSDEENETEAPPTTQRVRTPVRYSSRNSANLRTTTSAPLKSTARQPFIVRGDSKTTTTSAPSYRRNSRPNTRPNTSSTRPKTSRQSYNSQTTARSNSRSTGRSRTRGNTRINSRQRNSYENLSGERFQNQNHILNDGKIIVTHQIPTEATISVVNGKMTEYKNIITAKPSLQTLLPNQILTSLGPLGNQQLYLADEATEIGDNGATKIIKFLLNEIPTSTVIFTPTVIRGRKTSYSHILPSTIYNVERITSTLSPEISANVPLANLLLSQLLLGNQQPGLNQINPLLALQGQGLVPPQQVVQTPITEYKTRTTTYVTTVIDNRETVLEITYRGTPIKTTIIDPTVNVITATEYITDTIVTAPTAVVPQPQPQFNSLLLPFLLQQQQQQQMLALNTPNPLSGLGQPDLNVVQNNNLFNNDIYNNNPKPNILSDFNSNEDFVDESQQDSNEDVLPPPPPPPQSSRPKIKPKPAAPKVKSIVTLYVSGRTPGEFSTVLSTILSDETQNVRKREAIYFDDVKLLPSVLPSINDLSGSEVDFTENSVIDPDKYLYNFDNVNDKPTQSLESIVGELTDHIKNTNSATSVLEVPAVRKEATSVVMLAEPSIAGQVSSLLRWIEPSIVSQNIQSVNSNSL